MHVAEYGTDVRRVCMWLGMEQLPAMHACVEVWQLSGVKLCESAQYVCSHALQHHNILHICVC
jgi:hypothetical protein